MWRHRVANRTVVKIKRYTSGPLKVRLNIGTIITELVLHMKNINLLLIYLIKRGRLKIGQALIPHENGKL